MSNLEQEREAFMDVLNKLDYDKGVVLGSYVGKLEHKNKRYREFLEYLLEEALDHKKGGLRIQHWALIADLRSKLEELE